MRGAMIRQTNGVFATYNQWNKTLQTDSKHSSYKKKGALHYFNSGGSGVEISAFRKEPDRENVVVKWGRGKYKKETLANEGAILNQLSHPYIIKNLESGQYKEVQGGPVATQYFRKQLFPEEYSRLREDGAYLVLPKYQKDLESVVSCTQLPDPSTKNPVIKLLNFMEQLLEVLVYLNDQEILHNDIKPANIFTDSNGKYVLADFGCAIEFGSSLKGSTGQFCAPEAREVDFRVGNRSDIFSLGATCYTIITGQFFKTQQGLTWSCRTPAEAKERLERDLDNQSSILNVLRMTPLGRVFLEKPERNNSGQINQLVELLMAMLSKDPNNRPTPQKALETVRDIQKRLMEEFPQDYIQRQSRKIQPLNKTSEIRRDLNSGQTWCPSWCRYRKVGLSDDSFTPISPKG